MSERELAYRGWVGSEGLFLNPLNDFLYGIEVASDPFQLPTLVTSIDAGPYFQGFYNQMKQEYASARYLLYLGLTYEGVHFSDRDVLLLNTLDYPDYSYSAEVTKSAFRTMYSLLDKVALFLNWYMELGMDDSSVHSSRFWTRDSHVRETLSKKRNWPLRGLYWLHRDLYEEGVANATTLEPDARRIWDIRRHLEHRYLKLHTEIWPGRAVVQGSPAAWLEDTKAYSVYRAEFNLKALRLTKLARAALIYLSLAVHWEEKERKEGEGETSLAAPIILDRWEDDWKI